MAIPGMTILAYVNPGYANPGYANPGYVNPEYANPGYEAFIVKLKFVSKPCFLFKPHPRRVSQSGRPRNVFPRL